MRRTNNHVVHEGVIRDIVDLISDNGLWGDTDIPFLKKNGGRYFSSITKATSNLILTFPVICDESVPLNTAIIVTKAIERKIVVMLQMLFAAVNIENNKDAFDFIGKVHKNLTSDDVISFINKMDSSSFKDEATQFKEFSDGTKVLSEAWNAYLKEPKHYLVDALKPSLESKFSVDPYTMTIHEANHKDEANRRAQNREELDPNDLFKQAKTLMKQAGNSKDAHNDEFIKNQVLDTDIKKANEAQPSLMIIHFRSNDPGSKEKNTISGDAVIGVKAKLIYVSQDDMINRIMLKKSDQNTFFSILRTTTGELSMIKDLMFAIDRAKMDVYSRKTSRSSPIWKLLERRAIVNKGNRLIDHTNGNGTSIATLLISSDTEDRLYKDFSFKCNPSKIINIMRDYSVMGFVITDDVTEKARFFWDDDSTNFETLSYTALEREDKSQYKKMMNLLVGK